MNAHKVDDYNSLSENIINGTVPFETDPTAVRELLLQVLNDSLETNQVKLWKVNKFKTHSGETIYLPGRIHQFQKSFETAVSYSNGYGVQFYYKK